MARSRARFSVSPKHIETQSAQSMTQEIPTIEISPETIAKKIRFLLRTESMTLAEMADRIGVNKEHLQYVVDGISKPTIHLLEKFCATFNVNLDFFGKGIEQAVKESRLGKPVQKSPQHSPLPFTPDSKKRKAQPIGVIPKTEEAKPKKKRQFDLAELAAHHQALLECLFELKIVPPDLYMKKLEDVRERAGLT